MPATGQVEVLGAGGRHEVGGVAGQVQLGMLHGLDHEAAPRGQLRHVVSIRHRPADDRAVPLPFGSNENINGLLRQYLPLGVGICHRTATATSTPSPANSTDALAKRLSSFMAPSGKYVERGCADPLHPHGMDP